MYPSHLVPDLQLHVELVVELVVPSLLYTPEQLSKLQLPRNHASPEGQAHPESADSPNAQFIFSESTVTVELLSTTMPGSENRPNRQQ